MTLTILSGEAERAGNSCFLVLLPPPPSTLTLLFLKPPAVLPPLLGTLGFLGFLLSPSLSTINAPKGRL